MQVNRDFRDLFAALNDANAELIVVNTGLILGPPLTPPRPRTTRTHPPATNNRAET